MSETESELDREHYHEVLHTAYVIEDMFQRHIVEHRAVEATPRLQAAAALAADALAGFYQEAGAARFAAFDVPR